MSNTQSINLQDALSAFTAGGVLCYPTEAVYGLGCDPDNEAAVTQLLNIKQRDVTKGLILVADNYGQCLPYVDDAKIPMDKRADIFSSWPGPITWLLPAKASTPGWLTGAHDTIAIRISAHPVIKALCQTISKPLVSTSANISGAEPVMSITQARDTFQDQVACYVTGQLGDSTKPSQIKHALSGALIRGNQ
ncbi:Sua5/YciO/YrdC/YwlC family protein [Pseudoalteromonas sp. T1lg23B]|uniref:Sua5/YciO/YrdC/YwlC family protein n=1 Tax=Pseudoalteromonas sp. T1lg23B TaxID=2077097 RepID=UPI000CF737C0|nr:Sua5/YciO/YrdC/YwlC family protein [Pseudoalteromonas sp. T1lg23B]